MRALLAVLAGVIPWIPAVPPPTPHPPLAPGCLAAHLRIIPLEVQGATGSLAGGFGLRNDGPPCSLLGRPHASFDPPYSVVPRPSPIPPATFPVPPSFSLRAIPIGAQVSTELWWTNWCGPPPTAMLVTLPHGGGIVRVPTRFNPRCDGPGAPTEVSLGPFMQSGPPPRPSTHLPFAIAFTRSLYAAHAGSALRYQVTLRNTSRKPFRFGKCPVYTESLVETTIIDEQHVLNCRPAGVIGPGATRVFAMQMRVPRRAAGKQWALFFELGPDTYLPDQERPRTNPMVLVS